jgi:hypothetical protein
MSLPARAKIHSADQRNRRGSRGPDRVRSLDSRGPETDHPGMTTLQRVEAADHAAIEELDRLVIVKSAIDAVTSIRPEA